MEWWYVIDEPDERGQQQQRNCADGGFEQEERDIGTPHPRRDHATRKRTDPEPRQVDAKQGAERKRAALDRDAQDAEPDDFERERKQSRAGEDDRPRGK